MELAAYKDKARPMSAIQTGKSTVPPFGRLQFSHSRLATRSPYFRLLSFVAAVPTGAIWLIGSWLNPNSGPLGIERQLGTPRCGFYAKYGIPCPTCGWTTAVSHLYHGQIFQAFITQPAGAIFGLVMLLSFSVFLGGFLTGVWLGPDPDWLVAKRYGLLGWCVLILALSWGYKVWAVHCWPATMQ